MEGSSPAHLGRACVACTPIYCSRHLIIVIIILIIIIIVMYLSSGSEEEREEEQHERVTGKNVVTKTNLIIRKRMLCYKLDIILHVKVHTSPW